MLAVSTDVPDEATRAAVLALAARIEAEDGAPPLSDQTLTQLRSRAVTHATTRAGGQLVGYAQREGDAAEIAGTTESLEPLLAAISVPALRVWSHGRRSRLRTVLPAHGFSPVRELYQLRRPLTDLPDDPPLPDGVIVRAFERGRDEDAWLAINASAFAGHPEQGRWRRPDLEARMAEPWFDPAGFLLAERGSELVGFHWTKIHPDGTGEVYVLGISPAAQGAGLGNALLVRGLRHLAKRGCPTVLLYVDGDNPAALRLYARAGFAEHDLDVQWQLGSRPS